MGVNDSTNMNLPIPQVGNEPGPQYATDVNNCLTLIDQHDHTPGYGVQIPPAGLNINSDLTIQDNNLTNIRSTRFFAQPTPLSTPADLGCVYVSGVDLYYNDESGNQIRLTQSGAVAGTPGSIVNLVPPASVTYVPSSQTFIFQSAVNTPAYLDSAAITLRDLTLNSFGLTLNPPASMTNDYDITLPTLPASNLPMSIDASGTITAALITQSQLVPSVANSFVPSGAILPFGGISAPNGFLLCDGTSYLRTSQTTLFAAISTAYGAADSTHFNVPDLRGQFLRGVSGGSGVDPDASSRTAAKTGGNTGNNIGSAQADSVITHEHLTPTAANTTGGGGTFFVSGSSQVNNVDTGAFGGNETRPVNIYVNYIIKT